MGNSSLTQSSRELEKSALDRQQVLSRTDFSAQPTNLAQDTRIADSVELSLRDSAPLSAESWQSIKIKKDKNAKKFK